MAAPASAAFGRPGYRGTAMALCLRETLKQLSIHTLGRSAKDPEKVVDLLIKARADPLIADSTGVNANELMVSMHTHTPHKLL